MSELFDFPEHVINFVKKTIRIDDKSSIEEVISFLKENKISQLRSVYLLNTIGNIPFSEANLYVANSKAWNG